MNIFTCSGIHSEDIDEYEETMNNILEEEVPENFLKEEMKKEEEMLKEFDEDEDEEDEEDKKSENEVLERKRIDSDVSVSSISSISTVDEDIIEKEEFQEYVNKSTSNRPSDIDIDNCAKNYNVALSQSKRLDILPSRDENEKEVLDKKIANLNNHIQRRLIMETLLRKGKSLKKEDENKRRFLVKKMKRQVEKSMKKEKLKTKNLENYRIKRERFMKKSAQVFRTKIIPNFKQMKYKKDTRKLWKEGLPSNVRGTMWKLSIQSQSKIHITIDLYNILKNQKVSDEDTNETVKKMIEIDLNRTFPSLQIFQKGGPYHESFREVLEIWSKFRPDISYIQGMSYLVALLLLNMDCYSAFKCLSILITSKKFHFSSIYTMKKSVFDKFNYVFQYLLREKILELYEHFKKIGVNCEVFLIDWFMTLFSKSFPLDVCSRLWDNYLIPKYGGILFLYKATLGILLYFFPKLIKLQFDEIMHFLSHIKQQAHPNERELFRCINLVKISKKQIEKAENEYDLKLRESLKKKKIEKKNIFNNIENNNYNNVIKKEPEKKIEKTINHNKVKEKENENINKNENESIIKKEEEKTEIKEKEKKTVKKSKNVPPIPRKSKRIKIRFKK